MASSTTSTSSPSKSSYDGMSGISLDAFQTQIESKLRQPFTSLELPKSLSTTTTTTGAAPSSNAAATTTGNDGGSSIGGDTTTTLSPSQFIINLQKCFGRMTKPIQLRCLIGLLGFEPNIAALYEGSGDSDEYFNHALRDLLENDGGRVDDNWVQIMSGIIRGKLFRKDVNKSSQMMDDDDNNNDEDGGGDDHDHTLQEHDTGRNKIADTIIKKACEKIITSITDASSDAVTFRNEAEVALTQTESQSESEDKKMEELLDSFQIGTDVKPNYVRWCFRLCDDQLVRDALPELDERCDFMVNDEADILKIDERLDRKKAEEERKELEQKERMRALAEERKKKMSMNGTNGNGHGAGNRHGGHSSAGIKMRGIAGSRSTSTNANAASMSDTAALMMRSKKGKLGVAGGARSISGRMGGGTAASGKQRRAGLGRGAAADRIGGKSLANPMARMRAGMGGGGAGTARGLLNSSRRPGATATNAGSSLAMNSGRNANNRNKTKMKMIDVAEVEGLKKEEEERKQKMSLEEDRENRKRKIREKAAANGLLSKKKWSRSNPTNSDTKKEDNAPIEQQGASGDSGGTNTTSGTQNAAVTTAAQGAINVNGHPQHTAVSVPDTAMMNAITGGYGIQEQYPMQLNDQTNAQQGMLGIGMAPSVMNNMQQNPMDFGSSFDNATIPQHHPAMVQQPFHDNIMMAAASQQLQQQQHHQQSMNNQRVATAAQFPPRLNASRPVQQQAQQQQPDHGLYSQQHYQQQHQHQQPIPEQNIHSQQHPQQQHPQITHHHQLLEKSNKLSADDRFRVEQFFSNRYNPTPEISVYKMKLNEEKTFDPTTNQTIKETLYIELDYTTGEFKKLKKIKKSHI